MLRLSYATFAVASTRLAVVDSLPLTVSVVIWTATASAIAHHRQKPYVPAVDDIALLQSSLGIEMGLCIRPATRARCIHLIRTYIYLYLYN